MIPALILGDAVLYPDVDNDTPCRPPMTPNQHTLLVDDDTPAHDVVYQGWVLKKRRRKMQGFARRYFVLHHSGILAYSFEPGQPIRDQLSLHHAAVSTAPGRKDIHLDSSAATFHIKCLSADDFNTWLTAFRKFISFGIEARRSASVRLTPRPSVAANKSGAIAEMMGSTIASLEHSILSMSQDLSTTSKKHHSVTKKLDKEKLKEPSKDSKFGLFKRSVHHSSSQEFGTNSALAESSLDNFSPSVQRVISALETLKSQHASLLLSIQALAESGHSNSTSPLPVTTEEDEHVADRPVPWSATLSSTRHTSIATTLSDSTHEWFDALDGAEEFLMDVQIVAEGNEQPSYMTSNGSRSSVADKEAYSVDTDSESHNQDVPAFPASAKPQVTRRTKLPALPTWDEGSMFTILKKNVGKDLSTITFPVTFNEPLTLLQRAAEELEYYNTLDEAVKSSNSIDRMCYVAAFAVSTYAHTRHRSGRKGFNPMLGETFEDKRMKFIAEKVRHNPLELAYHAEGDGWDLTAVSSGKTKFWGKSLEIIPLGSTRLNIGNDTYVWKKPSSFMRNLMVGTKYFEHTGNMIIQNMRDHTRCVLEFKQNGYWGPSNVVSGTVHGPSGEILCHLEGKWDDQMSQTLDSSNFRILWRMMPFPQDTHENYGFTAFAIALNEMSSDIVDKLPPTDSRLRPDVRALENGDLEAAEEEKARIEEMQRERRRQGKDRQPRWFRQHGDEWAYCGGYWEARAQDWRREEIQPLW